MTISFETQAVTPIPAPRKKGSLMPLLTVVFIASYGLMTMLIVEQGATIQSQRSLIMMLQGDSTQFWAMKGKALHEKQMAAVEAQRQAERQSQTQKTPANQTPSTQAPSNHAPSTQNPSTQVPSKQAETQRNSQTRSGKVAKPHEQLPPVPASDLGDQRRALVTL